MRLSSTIPIGALLYGTQYLPGAHAWGAAGHEIVATIAQMYLHPTVLPTLCEILDLPLSKCHIASVATWADQHRFQMRWSAPLHYIGSLDDFPSKTCAFPGPNLWAGSQGINVLDAIQNTTKLLQDWVNEDVSDTVASEALKFLIHFVGDMHQPLHLTGRARGGNSVKILFGRRHTNLHSLWDGFLIAKAVRTVPANYSRPLPYPQVEKALRGTIYDPYIRRILFEGILNPWGDDLPKWLSCPTPAPTSSGSGSGIGLLGMWESIYTATAKVAQMFMKDGVDINPDGAVVCPYFWAQPIHKLNCDIVWPPALDDLLVNTRFHTGFDSHIHEHDVDEEAEDEVDDSSFAEPLLDLDKPEYAGVIEKQMIVEKLLAQGGIRLAGLLNYLFARDKMGNPSPAPFLVDSVKA